MAGITARVESPGGIGWLAAATGWLARPPLAVRHGVKWGLAMSSALYVAHASIQGYGLPQPSYLIATIAFVAQPQVGASAQKAMLRIIGTILAAFSAVLIWGISAQFPALEMLLLFLVITAGVYVMTGPKMQYAGTVFAFTTLIILGGAYPFKQEHVETIAFERTTLVILAVLIVFLVDALLWPERSGERLRQELASRSERLKTLLQICFDAMLAGGVPAPAPPSASGLMTVLPLVGQLRLEIGVTRARADAAQEVALRLEGLALRGRQLHELLASGSDFEQSDSFRRVVQRLRDEISTTLEDFEQAISQERSPGLHCADVQAALAQFETDRVSHYEQALADRESDGRVAGAAMTARAAPILRDLVQQLGSVEQALGVLAGEERARSGGAERRSVRALAAIRIDPVQLQIAIRAGLSVCFSIWFVLAAGWPANSMCQIMAFMLAASPAWWNTKVGVSTILKVAIAGVVVADLALVVLFPSVQRMPAVSVFVFGLVALTGYLVVANPKSFAPKGPMFLVLVLMPIFVPGSAPTDVYGPYNTACYVVVGAGSALLASAIFWPATALQVFWKHAAIQLGICRQLAADAIAGRGRETFETMGQLVAYAGQLASTSQLHGQLQAEPDDEEADDEARGALLSRMQALFDAAVQAGSVGAVDWDAAGLAGNPLLERLREALERQGEGIVESLGRGQAELIDERATHSTQLVTAQQALLSAVEELRNHPEVARELGVRTSFRIAAWVDARSQLGRRALEIEDWMATGRRATHAS